MIRIAATPINADLATVLNQPGDDDVHFWWLGQAGFALRWRDQLLLIDPYLSDSLAEKYRNSELKHLRMMPIPVAPQAISGCSWYLCTHSHTDHMDAQTIRSLELASAPHYIVPRAEAGKGAARGIPQDRLVTIDAGEQQTLAAGITVAAIPAAHERLETDEQGAYRFLGYVISLGNVRIYHSGDSIPYPGLEESLAEQKIDIAFLPINGRDVVRLAKGVPGNFTIDEAIALCRAVGIPHLVGHHFGMFDFNTIDRAAAAAVLQRDAGDLLWVLPEIGVTFTTLSTTMNVIS